MNRIKSVLKKIKRTLSDEGFKILVKKSIDVFLIKLSIRDGRRPFKDVLFVNGCSLSHPARYRVEHQMEQLEFVNFTCDSVFYEHISMEQLKRYRTFVFFRCPVTEMIEEFIKQAKNFNKKVFFDIDDLVIDEKYVNQIEFLKTLNKSDYNLYMDGVNRMNRTLTLCDYAITSTTRLAEELKNYVPEVYVNRNVASERMVELSLLALKNKEVLKANDKVIIGYFSGSITHNDDFLMIQSILKNIFEKYSNVYLKIVGHLDIPEALSKFKDRIVVEDFAEWEKLPELVASVDINIAPLEESIFNEAKSEIKWIEASLVKVPTVASNIGAFAEMIKDKETGILCNTEKEWEDALSLLVENTNLRYEISRNAHDFVVENCITANTGYGVFDFINSRLNELVVFVLPGTSTSGGVNVVVKHCQILMESGKDVLIVSMDVNPQNITTKEVEINVLLFNKTLFFGYFDKCITTLWSTNVFYSIKHNIGQRYYLVQGYETDFSEFGHVFRCRANLTYNFDKSVKYLTVSRWCQDWLKYKFRKDAKFAKNGIDLEIFKYCDRDFNGKIRILIEGSSTDHYKNVDESFEIANELDRDKFEVWYMSYAGEPKPWYKVDKFFHKIPQDQVGDIYRKCHILLKSSLLESFSYPPLEMMATGGIAVVRKNCGNVEYLVDRENCILFDKESSEEVRNYIGEICNDAELRNKIMRNCLKAVNERNWDFIKPEIIDLYK